MKLISYLEYQHSYTHHLEPKLKTLNYYANVLKKPPKYIKKIVINILNQPEVYFTEKEHLFFDTLCELQTSREIYTYVKNSINKAKETFVYVDDSGKLVNFA